MFYDLARTRFWVRRLATSALDLKWRESFTTATALVSRLFDNLLWLVRNSQRVECACCGWKGNSFSVFNVDGYKNIPGVLCPNCDCLPRYRLLLRYLRERTGFFVEHTKVLEIGPAKAFQGICLAQNRLSYTSVDRVRSGPRIDAIMDIVQLAFADRSFDVIVCLHVLEHVKDDWSAMEELFRVLKNGGFGILQVPINEALESTVEHALPDPTDSRHWRAYGRDYASRLEFVGFQVSVDDYAFQLGPEIIERYGLPLENIYLANKPFQVGESA